MVNRLALIAAATMLLSPVAAQSPSDYPNKPVKIIVANPAGVERKNSINTKALQLQTSQKSFEAEGVCHVGWGPCRGQKTLHAASSLDQYQSINNLIIKFHQLMKTFLQRMTTHSTCTT